MHSIYMYVQFIFNYIIYLNVSHFAYLGVCRIATYSVSEYGNKSQNTPYATLGNIEPALLALPYGRLCTRRTAEEANGKAVLLVAG